MLKMLGLSSRDALTTRQIRWVRDVSDAVNTQPSKNHNSSPKQLTTHKSIISYKNETSLDDAKLNERLSEEHQRWDDMDKRLQQIETYQSEIRANIILLTKVHLDIKSVIDRWGNSTNNLHTANDTTFIPYFNDEAFVGIDNVCKLVDGQLQLVIEIFGNIKDVVTLYPFGNAILTKELPKQLTIKIHSINEDYYTVVEIKRSATGVYVMELPIVDASVTRISYSGPI